MELGDLGLAGFEQRFLIQWKGRIRFIERSVIETTRLRKNAMDTDSLPTQSWPQKIFRGYLWIGVAWLVVSIACILVAEIFMDDSVHGNQGRLVFYRTWGPTALIGACVAAFSHRMNKLVQRSAGR